MLSGAAKTGPSMITVPIDLRLWGSLMGKVYWKNARILKDMKEHFDWNSENSRRINSPKRRRTLAKVWVGAYVRESPDTKTNNFGNTRNAVFNSFNFYGPFCKSQLRLYLTLKTRAFVAGWNSRTISLFSSSYLCCLATLCVHCRFDAVTRALTHSWTSCKGRQIVALICVCMLLE